MPTKPQAMWVWNIKDSVDPLISPHSDAQIELFTFCQQKNIKKLFFNLNFSNQLSPAQDKNLADFLKQAHQKSINVQLLDGDKEWALSKNHSCPETIFKNLLEFNSIHPSESQWDGLHLDIECYLLSEWEDKKRRGNIVKDYLSLFAKLRKRAKKITLAADICPWFFTGPETIGKDLIKYVDELVIMSYRDHASGPNGIIDISKRTLKYADKTPIKVYVGLETGPISDIVELDTTFAGKSLSYLEAEVQKAETAFSAKHSSFEGIAIHHYDSYRKMTE